jgi:hypothetical protein
MNVALEMANINLPQLDFDLLRNFSHINFISPNSVSEVHGGFLPVDLWTNEGNVDMVLNSGYILVLFVLIISPVFFS